MPTGCWAPPRFRCSSVASSPRRASSRAGDVAKSQPQLAVELIAELLAWGLRFRGVLAESLYGESGPFIAAWHRLHRLHLPYVGALRSTHGVWMLPGQRIRQTRWRPFARVFTDGSTAQRFLRATVYGARRSVRYYPITTDPSPCRPRRRGTS